MTMQPKYVYTQYVVITINKQIYLFHFYLNRYLLKLFAAPYWDYTLAATSDLLEVIVGIRKKISI